MFVCICCGAQAPNVYTRYSKEIINLQLCGRCGRIVDKYVEYDFTIIAIDLLVYKIEAYRHILRNVDFPRIFHLLLLSCILSGFLGWICTENFDHFDADTIHAAVNSDLYFYILLKISLTFTFGFLLCVFSHFSELSLTMLDITKLLTLTNLCSLMGLLMYPWKDILLSYFSHLSILFAPLLGFLCVLLTTIPAFMALTNAPCTLSSIISFVSCGLVFIIEYLIIKIRFVS
uniref:Protein ARV n=1 Tax=Echinococcus granulosus TaxID=6210 RepID=A0A068W7C6_ECHGR|nr:protein ARV1 [Echinococcus granulosus]